MPERRWAVPLRRAGFVGAFTALAVAFGASLGGIATTRGTVSADEAAQVAAQQSVERARDCGRRHGDDRDV